MKASPNRIPSQSTSVFTKQASLIALLFILPLAVAAQTAVFTDTFSNGSTTNLASVPGGTPTASSTSYDIASTKNTVGAAGVTIAPNDLRLSLAATTSSGLVEAQALFASGPIALVTIGDFINVTYTFTNTTGTLLAGGTSSYIFAGLYNSSNSAPLPGNLAQSGLTSTVGSTFG